MNPVINTVMWQMIGLVALVFAIAYFVFRQRPQGAPLRDAPAIEGWDKPDFKDTEGDAYVQDMAKEALPFPELPVVVDTVNPFPVHFDLGPRSDDAHPFPEFGPVPFHEQPGRQFAKDMQECKDALPFPEQDAQRGGDVLPFPESAIEPAKIADLPVTTEKVKPLDQIIADEAQPFPETTPMTTIAAAGMDMAAVEPFPEATASNARAIVGAMQDRADADEAQPFPETETPAEVIRLESGQTVDASPIVQSPVDGVDYEEIRQTHRKVIEEMNMEAARREQRIHQLQGELLARGELLKRKVDGYEKILACVRSYYNASDKRWLTALKREYLK